MTEGAVRELEDQIHVLEDHLAVERAFYAMLLEGHRTVPAMVTALRRRAIEILPQAGPDDIQSLESDRPVWVSRQVMRLATTIEQETGIS